MIMRIRGSLAVMAGAVVAIAGIGVASAQFVSLDGAALPVASRQVDSGQRVSKTFDHVPAKDVVAWARSRNLPLNIADQDIPDRDVTVTFTGVDAIDVGPLLADAMGMRAERDGDRYTLRPATGPDVTVRVKTDALPTDALEPAISSVGEIPQVFERVRKEMGLKDLKDIDQADDKTKRRFQELVEKYMGDWSKKFEAQFDSKEFQQKMDAWGKDFAKKYDSPEFKAKMEAFAKQFDTPEFRERVKRMGHVWAQEFDSPEWKGKMDEWQKEWDSPEHRKAMEDMAKKWAARASEMKVRAKDFEKMRFDFQDRTESDSILKLLDSLDARQKELMTTQGYLTPADLTPTQRGLLGDLGKGSFELSYTVNGKSIRIKSKDPKGIDGIKA